MNHLKPYKIFENQGIVMAGINNSLEKYNLELFKDLTEQYSDLIDYRQVVDKILEHKSDDPFNAYYTALDPLLLPFMKFIPSEHFSHISTLIYTQNKELTELDVTMMEDLRQLNCSLNNLNVLYVNGLRKLKLLNCSNNGMKELNLKGLYNLEILQCTNNHLPSLDVSDSPHLRVFQSDLPEDKIIR